MKNSKILNHEIRSLKLNPKHLLHVGHTRFDDLPGWYATPVTSGFVIYDNEKEGSKNSVGFYNTETKTFILMRKISDQIHQPCDNLHQAMRLAYLLIQEPAAEKEVTIGPDRRMRFRDMPGFYAQPYVIRRDKQDGSGQVSFGGHNIYNDKGVHVAHYHSHFKRTGKNLWLHPNDEVIAVQPFPNLLQAVRFVYLQLQEPAQE